LFKTRMSFKIERDRTYDNERVVSLLECGNLKVDGEIFPVAGQVITVGNANFPTIQSAFNSLAGRAVNDATIILPGPTAGGLTVYNEIVTVENMNSVVSQGMALPASQYPLQNLANLKPSAPGLTLIGDTRYISGMAYISGAQLNYYNDVALAPATGYVAKLGTPYGVVQLLNPGANQIQVNMTSVPNFDPENRTGVVPGGEQPDFVAAGVLPGDHLLIRDDSLVGVWQEVIVVSASGNTITYSGTNVPNLTLGAALYICPRVQITTTTYAASGVFNVYNSKLSAQGVWFKSSVPAPVTSNFNMNAVSLWYGGEMFAGQCLFDCKGSGANGLSIVDYGEIGSENAIPMHNSVRGDNAGSSVGIFIAAGGRAAGGDWTVVDAGILGIEVIQAPSQAFFNSTNVSGTNQNYGINQGGFMNVVALLGSYRNRNAGAGSITTQRGGRIQLNTDNLQVNNTNGGVPYSIGMLTERGTQISVGSGSVYGTVSTPGSQIVGCVTGIVMQDGSDISMHNSNPFGITNCGVGITGQNAARFNIFANILYTGITTAERAFDASSSYNAMTSTETPNGVITYTASGVMDSTIRNQLVDSGGALAITMNPATSTNGVLVYEGKSYNFYASSQHAHTLTLPGAFFVGMGTAATTITTFAGANPGEGLSFTVMSATQVQVTSYNGVNFS
jgi:hypothetical protein